MASCIPWRCMSSTENQVMEVWGPVASVPESVNGAVGGLLSAETVGLRDEWSRSEL